MAQPSVPVLQTRSHFIVVLTLLVVGVVSLPACTHDLDAACDRWCAEGRSCGASLSDECERSCALAEDSDFVDKVNRCTAEHGCEFTRCVDAD